MRFHFNKSFVPFGVILVCFLLVALSTVIAVGDESPYLQGVWKHKVTLAGQTMYMLCTFQGDLVAPKVRGTSFCSAPGSLEWPTPDGGKMTISAEMQGIWERTASDKYKLKGVSLFSIGGSVAGTLEVLGIYARQGEDKLVGDGPTDITISDLQGNVLMEMTSQGEFIRIKMD